MPSRDAAASLREASALRDLCLRLPRLPTGAALGRLRRFTVLIDSPESAGEADVEALVEGWKRWWYEGETGKLAAMASRVPETLTAKDRFLATYATAARLAGAEGPSTPAMVGNRRGQAP